MRSSVVDEKRSSPVRERREPISSSQTSINREQATKLSSRSSSRRLAPIEGWLPLLLLAIALYCVVSSIIAAGWVSHSTVLLWSPAFGLLVGLGIAKLPKLPQAILHLAACLIGYWLAIWLTSAVAFHMSWLLLLEELRAAVTGTVPPGPMPAEIVFFFYLAFLCFFLGYFGSWLVYRAHLPWLVALVYCSILLVNLNYVKKDLSYLVIILVGALILLVARMRLIAQIQDWVAEGLHTDSAWMHGITRRGMQIACVLTLIALLVSWVLPIQNQTAGGKTFWNQLDNAWNNIINGHASLQNLGSLTQPYQAPTNFFSNQLTVSGSVHLPVGQVLYYTSTGSQPRYLEGFTYNNFDGHTWTTSLTNSQSYDANTPLPIDTNSSDYSPVSTAVTVVQPPEGPEHYIFGPPQPASFDTATIVYSDATAGMWIQQSPLTQGEHYNVTSMVTPNSTTLLSGVPLPAPTSDIWSSDANYQRIVPYYTQVPQDLSPNVQNTAKKWTAGATNTYSALKMLETNLSNQSIFTYSVANPPVPSNVDVVDWLLQTRSGYCTYYASAMVVMARQLGIPARMVNGFSQGHFDVQHQIWSVDGQDAHSWVQAYLPSFGWVNFDPTPGFAANADPTHQVKPVPTPTKATTQPTPVVTPPPATTKNLPHPTPPPVIKLPASPQTKGQGSINQSMLMGIAILLLLLSLLVFLSAMISYWWRNLYTENGLIAAMFWRLCWLASRAGLAPRAWQTPYEYSNMLGNQLPQQATPLSHLTDLFVRERWGPTRQAASPNSSEEETVRRLSPSLRTVFLHLLLRKVKK